MAPELHAHYQRLAEKYKMEGPFLEIGAARGSQSILTGNYFKERPDRIAVNLRDDDREDGIIFYKCNSNDMRGIFPDNRFQTVLSNAVLEHDRYFWRSVEEMRRVLAPGGILAVGAPGFIPREQLHVNAAITGLPAKAPATIICEGLEVLELRVVGVIPRLVAVARKPSEI
jgi:SAM-dependent methyltransferase